jgi:hypothetical protein
VFSTSSNRNTTYVHTSVDRKVECCVFSLCFRDSSSNHLFSALSITLRHFIEISVIRMNIENFYWITTSGNGCLKINALFQNMLQPTATNHRFNQSFQEQSATTDMDSYAGQTQRNDGSVSNTMCYLSRMIQTCN